MANVKERYTQVTREARNGRFVAVRHTTSAPATQRDSTVVEEERLAATFRRRARDDYQAA